MEKIHRITLEVGHFGCQSQYIMFKDSLAAMDTERMVEFFDKVSIWQIFFFCIADKQHIIVKYFIRNTLLNISLEIHLNILED